MLDLQGDGRQVGLNLIFQQAALLGCVALRLRCELQALQERVLVREFVDQGLIELDLLRQVPNCLAQLFGVERFKVWQIDHRQACCLSDDVHTIGGCRNCSTAP